MYVKTPEAQKVEDNIQATTSEMDKMQKGHRFEKAGLSYNVVYDTHYNKAFEDWSEGLGWPTMQQRGRLAKMCLCRKILRGGGGGSLTIYFV